MSLVLSVMVTAASGVSHSHRDEDHGKKTGPVKNEQTDWGIAGDARQARHTTNLTMADTMRFAPE